MKPKIFILTIAAAIAFASATRAGSYRAQNAPQAPSTSSKIIAISGSLKGTYSYQVGRCHVGFSDQCKSIDCMCYTMTGTANLTRVGKGPATMYATLDFGAGATSGPDGDCFPVWAELLVNGAKDAQNWHAVGYACDGVDGKGTPILGGLVLGHSNMFSQGIAQFTMQFNFAKYTCSMSIKGKAGM